MKNCIILALLLVSTSLSTFAQHENEKPYQTKSLSSENIRMVEVKTTGGNITMMGSSAAESKIEVYIHANNGRYGSVSYEELQKRLTEDYDLSIQISNNKLTAIAHPKNGFKDWNNGLSISFKIWVSNAASGDLKTSGGNISMKNFSGSETFTTSGGNLMVDNLTGKTKGRTSGGNVYLKNSSNNIELVTSGGNIEASNSTGEIDLGTSGGDIMMEKLGGTIKARTSGGSVRAANIQGSLVTGTSGGNIRLLNMSCTLEAGTSGGNITASISKMGEHLKLSNSGGNIDVELPSTGINLNAHASRVKLNSMQTFKGTFDEHNINGTLNGGGVPVNLSGGEHISVTVR